MRERLATEPKASPSRTGAIVLAVAVLLLAIALTHQIPFLGGEDGKLVKASFAQANEVNDSTPVRVRGVDVGRVQQLEPGPNNTTILLMRITRPGIALHSDASARIAWRTLLGGSMVVDLDPGSRSAPALAGAIPLSATSSQVDWDQLNSVLPAPTRRGMQQMLAGIRAALSAPTRAASSLHALGPALATIGPASDALRGQDIGDLPDLIRTAGLTARALSSDEPSLQGLIDGAARTLAVTASDRAALAQTLHLAPPALDSTTATMTRLDTTLVRLDPLVAQLRPAARELAPTTTVLRPLLAHASHVLDDAVPLLRAAPSTLRALGAMSKRGVPLIGALTPTVKRLNSKLIPFLNSRDSDTRLKIYESIAPTLSAIDSAASQFDGSTWFLHFDAGAAANTLSLPCDPGYSGDQLARCNAVSTVLQILLGGGQR